MRRFQPLEVTGRGGEGNMAPGLSPPALVGTSHSPTAGRTPRPTLRIRGGWLGQAPPGAGRGARVKGPQGHPEGPGLAPRCHLGA